MENFSIRNMCKTLAILQRFPILIATMFMVNTVAAAPQVSEVRVGVYANKTRVVLDLSGIVNFRAFTLPRPYRVVVDMPEVTWSPKLRNPPRGGLVTGMRFGLFQPGSSRVVLDSDGPVRITKAFMIPQTASRRPYRIVLDIEKTSESAFMSTYLQSTQRLKAKAVEARQSRPAIIKRRSKLDEKIVVMIDPGHGGVDPGAISRSGVWEKHVVLAFAKELRRQLQATGKFEVRLTRVRDVFLRLRERIARARAVGADLFLSIHADSIRNPRVRGTSVYTLSERASDKEAAALARKENKSDLIAGLDLNEQSNEVANILIDLAQRETMNESTVFARQLVTEMGKVRKMLRNTHRFAGFAVLKAPDIPSVLIELGYLSNRADEKLLRDPSHRRRMATAMTRAIHLYFDRQQVLNRP
ncbi:MAG: N-acetylmuramoyl-L-alanine amidase [Pseudomonadota bacterium]|nr:N-acetylmuramoyl-L-alanine amidase [Pseudomonadota bacterium]